MYKVKLSFWGKDKGGRFTPPSPGYKPQIAIDDIQTSCIVTAENNAVTTFDFNVEYEVLIELMFKDVYGEKLAVGDSIRLYEGNKQVAEGTITAQI